jgi:tetratricopeptide (TPR) repeat protein
VRSWFREVITDAGKLALEARWEESRSLLEELAAQADLRSDERSLLDNNLAWTLAHLGHTARAIELAKRAVEQRQDAYAFGTLGACLVVARDATAALPWLNRSAQLHRKNGTDANAVSAVAYYQGEALALLDRVEEARAQWMLATTAKPGGHYSTLAQIRLRPPAPYR